MCISDWYFLNRTSFYPLRVPSRQCVLLCKCSTGPLFFLEAIHLAFHLKSLKHLFDYFLNGRWQEENLRRESLIALDVFIIAEQKLNRQTCGNCCNFLKNAIYSLRMLINSEAGVSVVV